MSKITEIILDGFDCPLSDLIKEGYKAYQVQGRENCWVVLAEEKGVEIKEEGV